MKPLRKTHNWRWIELLVILCSISCIDHSEKTAENPPYHPLGELKEPAAFEKGKLTTLNGISFSREGDVLYTSAQLEKQFDNTRLYAGIFESRFVNGEWTEPTHLPLGLDIDAYHPVLSFDNKLLFFNSRSHLDSGNTSVPHDIWAMQRTPNGWSTPKPVEGVNSASYDSYPSVAKSGNLYFNSDRDGGKGGMDFYVSYYVGGEYQEPVNLQALNSPDVENDLVVDPLERFIIFNRYLHETQAIDLYLALNKNGVWTLSRKLDKINSDEDWELTPTLSPDGKYFFYELNSQIMQAELSSLLTPDEIKFIGLEKLE